MQQATLAGSDEPTVAAGKALAGIIEHAGGFFEPGSYFGELTLQGGISWAPKDKSRKSSLRTFGSQNCE
jgi:hypothetical protein